jgi:uncharacterized membrane protein
MLKKLKQSQKLVDKIRKFVLTERGIKIFLSIIILLFIGYFIFVSFSRHDNFYSHRLDLGNMDQTVWNVAHGNGFTLTDPMGTKQESRLAVHADFILILLAPFYYFWSDPRMLILIQVIALAVGAIPIYWLAKRILGNYYLALVFGAAYLLYPTIQLNTLHDFHATSLTTTFLLFAYWYYVDNKLFLFLLCAIFAALGKEQFWIISAMFGVMWITKPKYRIFGISIAIISSVIFYLLFWKFIPIVTPAKQYWALTYLSEYGGSINDIMKNLFKHPLQVILSAFTKDRLFYYFQLLIPVAFLPFFAPLTLILAIPNLAINVLSNNQLMRMIDYQYTSGITPWIFTSAIYGFATIERLFAKIINKKSIRQIGISVILLTSISLSVYFWGELTFSKNARIWYFTSVQTEKNIMQKISESIPSKYSVSATNNIGAHFSQRKYLYNFPINADSADYVVVQLGDQYAWPSGDQQKQVLQSLLVNDNYEQIASSGAFYALKRRNL